MSNNLTFNALHNTIPQSVVRLMIPFVVHLFTVYNPTAIAYGYKYLLVTRTPNLKLTLNFWLSLTRRAFRLHPPKSTSKIVPGKPTNIPGNRLDN